MNTDRRILYLISSSALAVLLLGLFLPSNAARIFCALVAVVFALLSCFFIKKRSILSINKRTVLFLIVIIGLLYVMFYYLSGIKFGFLRSGYRFNLQTLLKFVLPITAIIIATELTRYVVRAQNSRIADFTVYAFCVLAEVFMHTSMNSIKTFNGFIDLLGIAFFPAILSNLLYHYLSKRYGIYPNIAYRLLTTLYLYLIPIQPAMPKSLFAFLNLIIPIAIYGFIDMLFEKKRRLALGKKGRFSAVTAVLAGILMTSVIMLISNQFRFGTLVIATDSMTGELNRGDAAIYERYDGEPIEIGQVIVFEKDNSMIVHRVVDIKSINGVNRYYTKGDVNEDLDAGYITASQIVGTVDMKLPYVGYPTIWLRSLFD